MTEPSLKISNLSHVYYDSKSRKKLIALLDVNIQVEKGEFCVVVGPSGCGKTTLLNIVAGLIKPSLGNLFIHGAPVNGTSQKIGFVFQQSLLLPWKTLLRNVTWGLEIRGVDRSEADRRAKSVIGLVGLNGFEDYHPNQLSGGMQQRANLARALVIEPEILLMDEPFANLDAQTREIMQLELIRIWENTKKSILFITHNISEAVYLADRVCVLTKRPGKVKDIIKIGLPRPRTLEIKRTQEFLNYEGRIWDMLELGELRSDVSSRRP